MTDCCTSPYPDSPLLPYRVDTADAPIHPTPSINQQHGEIAPIVTSPRRSPPVPAAASNSSSSSSSAAFSPRYALARRRRECLGLLESLRLSMSLSLKAITLLCCCVIMTLQWRAQQRRRAAAASSSTDESQQQPSASSAGSAFSSLFTSKSSSPTLYQRLNIESDATAEQIRAAHRRMAMRYHPDKVLAAASSSAASASGSGSAASDSGMDSGEMFIAIQEAYEVLSDPYERKRYDYSLLTGISYTRLPSALRNVRGRADKQEQQQEAPPFPAYIRRRPAAFTSTNHPAHFRDANHSSAPSSSNSSTASTASATTPPVRSSRSFSSIFTSPFAHTSPQPSTASTTSTTSSPPPYHSPASAASTPPASPSNSFSFLSTPHLTPTSAASASAEPAAAVGDGSATVWSSLVVLLADCRVRVSNVCRRLSVVLFVLATFPLRVALVIAAVAKERLRRMEADQRRMKEEEDEANRRQARDEASVCTYNPCG